MLYFQVVILAAAVMLVYYCEFTDTFSPAQQGFACRDPALTRPDPGPEQLSRIQPVILYSVVGGLPVVLVSLAVISAQLTKDKVVVMGDCCYVNPMVRRTFRFLGVYVFGLFATDILVNAGQLVTGSPAPYFLSVCQPNYTALGCQDVAHFVSQSDACTGDADDITRARKTFPSKEAALSLYTAVYLAMYVMSCIGTSGGRLTGPLLSLSLVSLAVLTGINRVAEYRNHWSDTIVGQVIGGAVAVFLVKSHNIFQIGCPPPPCSYHFLNFISFIMDYIAAGHTAQGCRCCCFSEFEFSFFCHKSCPAEEARSQNLPHNDNNSSVTYSSLC
uniref:Phosphatidic acid phosphatase type 2/haloperoxidase domain-containing protein n=1 Tax=Scophthalmus maximus TaxID=52904 RepID=A0A8D3CEP7_SCOMX